ncbi:MAG TPA: ABC-2 transporter permease [Syntrophomonadaceae bacterium]|nr:ABC-2 transporter permease [Syntrophomonadaceae bacterium]
MFQLIKKEFVLQKKTILFGFIYSIFLFFTFAHPVLKNFTYVMAAFGICYIIIIGAAQADYKNHSDIILNSFPLTRREIVLSRYLSIFVFSFLAVILTGIIGLFFHMVPQPFTYRLINLNDVVVTLVSVMFLAAVSLPAYFKSGAQSIAIVNIFLFLLIFFAPAQIRNYLMNNTQQPWVQSLSYMAREQFWLLSFSGIGAMLVLFSISYFVSLRIYLNKDF